MALKLKPGMDIRVGHSIAVPGFPINTDEVLRVLEVRKDRVRVWRMQAPEAWLYTDDFDAGSVSVIEKKSAPPRRVAKKAVTHMVVMGKLVKIGKG